MSRMVVFGTESEDNRYFKLRAYEDGSGVIVTEVDKTGEELTDVLHISYDNEVFVLDDNFTVAS